MRVQKFLKEVCANNFWEVMEGLSEQKLERNPNLDRAELIDAHEGAVLEMLSMGLSPGPDPQDHYVCVISRDGEHLAFMMKSEWDAHLLMRFTWGKVLGCDIKLEGLLEKPDETRSAVAVIGDMTFCGYNSEDALLNWGRIEEEFDASP